jgi:hypothetical protein
MILNEVRDILTQTPPEGNNFRKPMKFHKVNAERPTLWDRLFAVRSRPAPTFYDFREAICAC